MNKKAWYIEGYTMNGAAYCRDCVADTLRDDTFRDPYNLDEHDDFTPIFSSDMSEDDGMMCEHCFAEIGN